MYLRVKKDSVTSILLFIFNVFLVERGINSVPLKKIFRLLEPFQKSETSIRMGLSRGVQNRLFVNEKQGQEVYYRLTDESVQSFNYWQKTLARFQKRINMQFANWDGAWSIVLLDLPSRNKPDGYIEQFTQSLEQLGYGSLNKGHWISPYDFSADVIGLAHKYFLSDEIFIFHGSMQNKNPENVASEVWPVQELANKFKDYANKLNLSAGKLNTDPVVSGQVLTFLYNYGLELFAIIQDDPQLPLELLPVDWPGPKAARAFWEIREQVLPEANRFIDEVIF